MIVVEIVDPRDQEIPAVGPVVLRDAETGETALVSGKRRRPPARRAAAARARESRPARPQARRRPPGAADGPAVHQYAAGVLRAAAQEVAAAMRGTASASDSAVGRASLPPQIAVRSRAQQRTRGHRASAFPPAADRRALSSRPPRSSPSPPGRRSPSPRPPRPSATRCGRRSRCGCPPRTWRPIPAFRPGGRRGARWRSPARPLPGKISEQGGIATWEQRLTLAAFRTGSVPLPGIAIAVPLKTGTVQAPTPAGLALDRALGDPAQ